MASSGAFSIATIVKSADETVNNSTTLQDDDALTFAMGADEDRIFDFVIGYDSSTVADFKVAVAAPTGASGQVFVRGIAASDGGGRGTTFTNRVDLGAGVSLGGSGNDNAWCDAHAAVRTGATAGDVRLQWSQDTAEASNTIVRADSFLRTHPVIS